MEIGEPRPAAEEYAVPAGERAPQGVPEQIHAEALKSAAGEQFTSKDAQEFEELIDAQIAEFKSTLQGQGLSPREMETRTHDFAIQSYLALIAKKDQELAKQLRFALQTQEVGDAAAFNENIRTDINRPVDENKVEERDRRES